MGNTEQWRRVQKEAAESRKGPMRRMWATCGVSCAVAFLITFLLPSPTVLWVLAGVALVGSALIAHQAALAQRASEKAHYLRGYRDGSGPR